MSDRVLIRKLPFQRLVREIAQDFIHVHHLVPLCEIGEAYAVDPVNDLVPVCPNCHAIIHRRTPPLSIGEVKELLATSQRTQV